MDWLILHDFCEAVGCKAARCELGVFSLENGKINIICSDHVEEISISDDKNEIELVLTHGNYNILVNEIRSVEYDPLEDTYFIEFNDGSVFTMS